MVFTCPSGRSQTGCPWVYTIKKPADFEDWTSQALHLCLPFRQMRDKQSKMLAACAPEWIPRHGDAWVGFRMVFLVCFHVGNSRKTFQTSKPHSRQNNWNRHISWIRLDSWPHDSQRGPSCNLGFPTGMKPVWAMNWKRRCVKMKSVGTWEMENSVWNEIRKNTTVGTEHFFTALDDGIFTIPTAAAYVLFAAILQLL